MNNQTLFRRIVAISALVGFAIYFLSVDSLAAEQGFILKTLISTVAGATFGAVVGGVQLLVLRRKLSGLNRWIVANIIGAAIGGTLALPISEAVGDATHFNIAIFAGGIVLGLAFGISFLFRETVVVALGMLMAYGPVIALLLARKRLGGLKTATALVIWGTLIPTFEHASFSIYGSRTIASVPGHGLHLSYHFFMAGIFTIVAGIMTLIMAASQLRQGKRTGWYAILAALLIGGGFELSGAAGTLFHGVPPRG